MDNLNKEPNERKKSKKYLNWLRCYFLSFAVLTILAGYYKFMPGRQLNDFLICLFTIPSLSVAIGFTIDYISIKKHDKLALENAINEINKEKTKEETISKEKVEELTKQDEIKEQVEELINKEEIKKQIIKPIDHSLDDIKAKPLTLTKKNNQ